MPAANDANMINTVIDMTDAAEHKRSRMAIMVSLVTAILTLGPRAAEAACVPSAESSAVILCSGTIDSHQSFDPPVQKVIVDPLAVLNPTSEALTVSNGIVVVNQGMIQHGTLNNAFGIAATGSGNTIVNNGTIVRTGLDADMLPAASTGSWA